MSAPAPRTAASHAADLGVAVNHSAQDDIGADFMSASRAVPATATSAYRTILLAFPEAATAFREYAALAIHDDVLSTLQAATHVALLTRAKETRISQAPASHVSQKETIIHLGHVICLVHATLGAAGRVLDGCGIPAVSLLALVCHGNVTHAIHKNVIHAIH